MKNKLLIRDISWLSFNERVLQEADDPDVPLSQRIRFLGIFSNNMDEFFRVRVAALKRMITLGKKAKMHLEEDPESILEDVQHKVLSMQVRFEKVWLDLQKELKAKKILLIQEKKLTVTQQKFVLQYFNEEVRGHLVPLMIESISEFPVLSDKSIYLACTLSKSDQSIPHRYALVSVPSRKLSRFVILPSSGKEKHIILLEDIIRYCLPNLFAFFGYDSFTAHLIKVTRDAEIDLDSDVSTTIVEKIEKGISNRKKAKPVRLVYDKEIPSHLLEYLMRRLGLTHHDSIIPGGRVHNFKNFMDFPMSVFEEKSVRKKSFTHPAFRNIKSVSKVIQLRDVMLHFPYHSFNTIIDLLRESAIDPEVTGIKITCYRLAPRSKIINALTNAVRNGKQVTVVIELRARFDEEANLEWKKELEEVGVKVLIGIPGMKVHAKICLIEKKSGNKTLQYGFVSTGNLNEKTATIYGDHCLMTSNKKIMADIRKMFDYLTDPVKKRNLLNSCNTLLVSPINTRKQMLKCIDEEIKNAKRKRAASVTLKLNSLSDAVLIDKLYEAAKSGVKIQLIIRGICCMRTTEKQFAHEVKAVSIVDEYLEHARVAIFHNNGKEQVFISSADWMVRNLDHRLEATCMVTDPLIVKELKDILEIQLSDNIKARILNNEQNNVYVNPRNKKKIRSQLEIYQYLFKKTGSSRVADYYN